MTNIAASTALILTGPGSTRSTGVLRIRLPAWIAPLGLAIVMLSVMYAGRGAETPEQQDEAREDLAGEEG